MRYELSDSEWCAIRAMLPNKRKVWPVSMIGVFSTASFGYCDRGPPVARSSCHLWPSDHLLQSIRSLRVEEQ